MMVGLLYLMPGSQPGSIERDCQRRQRAHGRGGHLRGRRGCVRPAFGGCRGAGRRGRRAQCSGSGPVTQSVSRWCPRSCGGSKNTVCRTRSAHACRRHLRPHYDRRVMLRLCGPPETSGEPHKNPTSTRPEPPPQVSHGHDGIPRHTPALLLKWSRKRLLNRRNAGAAGCQPCRSVVVRDRIELSTFRFSGAIESCLGVAGRRLTGNLPAPIVAGRRPVSLGVCLRWLPVWLPDPAGGFPSGESSGYILIASPTVPSGRSRRWSACARSGSQGPPQAAGIAVPSESQTRERDYPQTEEYSSDSG